MKNILCLLVLAASALPWTRVTPGQTPPVHAQVMGWERLVFASAINSAVGVVGYEMPSSEPQNALLAYSVDQNRWNILDVIGIWAKSDYLCAGGHDFLITCYDENLHAVVTPAVHTMGGGHDGFGQYDVRGNIGRLYYATYPLGYVMASSQMDNCGTCFDTDSNCVYYLGGGNAGSGGVLKKFCRYKPSQNMWKDLADCPVSCTNVTIAYDKHLKKVIVPGGYAYDPATNAWESTASLSGELVYNELLQKTEGLNQVVYAQYTRGIVFSPFNNLYVSVEPGCGSYTACIFTQPSSAATPKPALTFSRETYAADARWKALSGPVRNDTTGWTREPEIFCHNGELFLAWSEFDPSAMGSSGGSYVTVSKWNGSSWQKLAQMRKAHYNDFPTFLSNGDSLYIGVDNFAVWANATAMHFRYAGGRLDTLGQGPKGNAYADGSMLPRMVVYRNRIHSIYLLYSNWRQYGGLCHSVWNEGSRSWDAVDTAVVVAPYSLGPDPAVLDNEFSATVKGDSIIAAFTGIRQKGKPLAIVTKVYDGTAWKAFAGISASPDTLVTTFPCLATNAAKTELYIAYLKRQFNGRKNNELFVERFNGVSWTPMGGALNVNGQDKDGWAFRPSLAVSASGVPYVAWTEHVWGSCPQVYVAHWDGTAWVRDFGQGASLNNDGISGSAQSVSLTFQNDRPTVAWSEHVFGNGRFRQIFVKQSDQPAGSAVEKGRIQPAGIRLTGQICRIYDIRGREITRGNPALLNLPNGLYILKARINGKTITDKMLVQK